MRTIELFIIFLFGIQTIYSEDKERDENEFIPTYEWQVVKKDQKIPKGLHIRMNFETGITEAKILDEEEKSNKHSALVEISVDDETEKLLDTDVMKEALKKIKNDEAHQFDNALEFVRQNGFKEIIYRNLNLTEDEIKEDSLKLFGSLVQNNAKVQIHALETGSIPIILRNLNSESSTRVKSRAVFALSCLLRRFPLAQLRFVQNGGLFVVTKLLDETTPIKIQIKLVTLMNDLLLENIQSKIGSPSENQHNLIKQYKLINLENLLVEQNWCKYLNELLVSILATDSEDHDLVEKCLISMHTMADKCVTSFSEEILATLKKRYEILTKEDSEISEDGNSDFFSNIHELCSDILSSRKVKMNYEEALFLIEQLWL
ncbi:hypothetical protein JTB14_014109 [Gonioctena quinquepunctata]|nr:hypothetical protein JTB14_014109 [Gonioctena quinquepunctata]